ncbi:hypothetical protein COOONC_13700, partial [Cooperia oncophora]
MFTADAKPVPVVERKSESDEESSTSESEEESESGERQSGSESSTFTISSEGSGNEAEPQPEEPLLRRRTTRQAAVEAQPSTTADPDQYQGDNPWEKEYPIRDKEALSMMTGAKYSTVQVTSLAHMANEHVLFAPSPRQ